MQKKQIIEKLIEIYQEAISEVTKSDDPIEACYAYGVQQGVCTAMVRLSNSSDEVRNNWLLMSDDITDHCDDSSPWWGPTPQDCSTKLEILESLEYRLFTLKQIIV